MDVIGKIEELMNIKGWTKYKLAKNAGLPQSTITSLLSGRVKNPSVESLTKIALALGTSLPALFGEIDPEMVKYEERERVITERLLENLASLADDEGYFFEDIHDDIFKMFDGELAKIGSSHFDSAYRSYLKEKEKDEEYDNEILLEEYREYYNYRTIKNEVLVDRSVETKEGYLTALVELNKKRGVTFSYYTADLSYLNESPFSYSAEKELGDTPIEELIQKQLSWRGQTLTEEQKQQFASMAEMYLKALLSKE